MTVRELIIELLHKPLAAEIGIEEECGAGYLTFTEPDDQASVAVRDPGPSICSVPAPVLPKQRARRKTARRTK